MYKRFDFCQFDAAVALFVAFTNAGLPCRFYTAIDDLRRAKSLIFIAE